MDRSGTTGSLTHYGVKGMKWGVRKADDTAGRSSSPSASSPQQQAPRPKLPVSDDVKAAAKAQMKIAIGGTQTLSNKELQTLLTRMNLERQYRQMVTGPPKSPQKSALEKGHQQVKIALGMGETVEKVRKFMKTDTGKAIKTGVGTAVAATAAYFTGGTSAAVAAGAGVVARRLTSEQSTRDDEDE